MKHILQNLFLLIFSFLLFSCHKDEEVGCIGPKQHWYSWEGLDSNRLTIPSDAFEQTFQLKDLSGNSGGILGVAAMYVKDQQGDTTYIITVLENGKNMTDTLCRDWFTIINEHDKLRLRLKKNDEAEPRQLSMAFWAYHINDQVSDYDAVCSELTIVQQSSENR